RHVIYSPDSTRIVTAGDQNTIRVWNAQTGGETLTLKANTASISFSPDGKRIVLGTWTWGSTAGVCDARTGNLLLTLKGHRPGVQSVAFSSDGKHILTAG